MRRVRSAKYLIAISTVLLALLLSNTGASAVQTGWYVSVSAGKWDRHNTVVSFPYKSQPTDRVHLVDDKNSGASIPLQLDGTTGTFVLPELKAGQHKSFHIVWEYGKSTRESPAVELTRVQNRLEIKVRGHQVLSFVAEPAGLPAPDIKPVFLRGGYIHPVFTPDGKNGH